MQVKKDKKEIRDVAIMFRTTEWLAARLDELCDDSGRSRSNMIERLITQEANRRGLRG